MSKFEKIFEAYQVNPADIGYHNIGWKYVFGNGYGASVITGGYGNKEKPYEVAVLKKRTEHNYDLCYDTPITDDVIGFLTDNDVIEVLDKIRNLDEWKEMLKNKSKDELLEMSYEMAQQLEMIEKIFRGEEDE